MAEIIPMRKCGHPNDTGLLSADPNTGKVEVYCWLCVVEKLNSLLPYSERIQPVYTTTLDELEKMQNAQSRKGFR